MKKQILQASFTSDHPDAPGLWLNRQRPNLIVVIEVTAKDIEQDKREPTWLNGEWGNKIEIVNASVAQSAEQDSLKVPVAGSTPAGRAISEEPPLTGMAAVVREKGFDDLDEFNRLVASADITTPERFAAFTEWKLKDGTKAGLMKLPSR